MKSVSQEDKSVTIREKVKTELEQIEWSGGRVEKGKWEEDQSKGMEGLIIC